VNAVRSYVMRTFYRMYFMNFNIGSLFSEIFSNAIMKEMSTCGSRLTLRI